MTALVPILSQLNMVHAITSKSSKSCEILSSKFQVLCFPRVLGLNVVYTTKQATHHTSLIIFLFITTCNITNLAYQTQTAPRFAFRNTRLTIDAVTTDKLTMRPSIQHAHCNEYISEQLTGMLSN
jgi:hypothetical protein